MFIRGASHRPPSSILPLHSKTFPILHVALRLLENQDEVSCSNRCRIKSAWILCAQPFCDMHHSSFARYPELHGVLGLSGPSSICIRIPLLHLVYFLRKEQPSVKRALPPVGWQSTVEQPAQTTTVCAWE